MVIRSIVAAPLGAQWAVPFSTSPFTAKLLAGITYPLDELLELEELLELLEEELLDDELLEEELLEEELLELLGL